MSLRDGLKKMSKSDPSDFSRIHLIDTADDIAQKFRKAKTDPEPLPYTLRELEDRPEAKNLLTIYATFLDQSLEMALKDVAGQPFSTFKPRLADVVIEKLAPISAGMKMYLESPGDLEKILEKGAVHANTLAGKTLRDVQDVIGFVKRF
jgi:tryptophanyl-tRNA synthetase